MVRLQEGDDRLLSLTDDPSRLRSSVSLPNYANKYKPSSGITVRIKGNHMKTRWVLSFYARYI
jgi:hypothetical protein